MHNYNSKFHWHKQVRELSQLPLEKHPAQLEGAAVLDVLDSYLPDPSVPPAVGISQRERRALGKMVNYGMGRAWCPPYEDPHEGSFSRN